MNLMTDTWRQLVRRRLWPVALLLVGAAAAIPFLLAKTPQEQPAAVAPVNAVAAASTDAADVDSVVALVDDKQAPAKRRRVLGALKDPFEPAALPKVEKAKTVTNQKTAVQAQATATPPLAPTADSRSSGTSDTPVTTPVTPVGTPAPPKKTYPHGSLQVRFGSSDAAMPKSTLERLEVLPPGAPLLVFDRLTDKGKTARFMVTGDVTLEGDGRCDPTPDSCETLELRKGETEFITVKGSGDTADVVYELDLLAIH
jgi:hypothetical protein